jgi:hypothetical protein
VQQGTPRVNKTEEDKKLDQVRGLRTRKCFSDFELVKNRIFQFFEILWIDYWRGKKVKERSEMCRTIFG